MSENKESKIQEQEPNVSSSVIYHIEKVSKRWIIFASVAFAAIAALLAFQMNINKENEREWRELFSDYDFISQDGEGINSINDGTQGDLNNGAESEEEEGQE